MRALLLTSITMPDPMPDPKISRYAQGDMRNMW